MNNATIRAAIAAAKLPEPEPGRLHICGIRVGKQGSNRFDDLMVVFGSAWEVFPCTVDPGDTYTLKPLNKDGCAHLTWGCWKYKIGTHRGKPALVQAAPVTVRRDRDRDGVAEPGEPLDTGYFGLNIHEMGDAPEIDDWSAGCQGQQSRYWEKFWKLILASGQQEFSYYLLPDAVTTGLL